ncbi:LysR family transcriptional regulator [Clostridium ljungdahlii]|uniref:HTH-type transcriptional regulator CysL n=1 Tax=Clostridium ljungdahlii TaxID=1538 RepID=A0A162N9E5_9CLOT|nr:LysR family transcriptional regulator [Clostridium ljungdahlii]OAA90559.1 HTH-type transcriptional regulator CysL [Clostridium ljungdahlii]
MTIRHLKIFITVCEEGNMTSAANKLFMTQPSISQVIKELENYYEVVLFERLSRKLYITSSGKKLYQYAKHIIKLFDEADNDLRQNSLQKKLIIGANYTVGVVLIHKYIKKFNKLYPNSEIMVNVNKSSILTEMLRKNELDLALIEEVKNKSDLVEDVFYNDHIVVVAHPKHHLFSKKEVTAHDIVNERLLLREKGSGVRNLFELRMNEIGLFFKPYWESTSTTALINAAENNIGIAVLPSQLIKDHIASGSLKELKVKDMDFNRKLTIVYHKNKLLTSAMKDFIKICHEP